MNNVEIYQSLEKNLFQQKILIKVLALSHLLSIKKTLNFFIF